MISGIIQKLKNFWTEYFVFLIIFVFCQMLFGIFPNNICFLPDALWHISKNVQSDSDLVHKMAKKRILFLGYSKAVLLPLQHKNIRSCLHTK